VLPDLLPVLERPPVRLRPFQADDVGLVVSVAHDPLIPLVTSVPRPGSRVEALAFIDRQHDRLRSGMGYSFAVADVTTNEAAGQIGVWLRDHDQGRVSIGYWIAPEFRRRGFAFAALRTVREWAWTLDGAERLELNIEPWNEGSWRTAERAGFRREGLMRAWQRVGLERRDMYMYSLLRQS
jgi:ribosomal-protein-alanine N-acetyltransferase